MTKQTEALRMAIEFGRAIDTALREKNNGTQT